MPVGKTSRKKKGSINEALDNETRHKKELRSSHKSSSKVGLQKTTETIKFIPILILLLVSFAVYFNALFGDFVYDDTSQILENPWLKDIRNITTIFSSGVWGFHPRTGITNYYRPMMHLVYMFNYHLFGLKPWGFHLVNILFHCGASVLVFLFIRRLLADYKSSMSSVYFSPPFIAAMLFAVHPIHTEAVTWIAGLPDVAFTFFYLLSFYFYIGSKAVPSSSYLFSVMCFAVAVFFKEPALTLPVLLLAHDYLFLRERTRFPDFVKRYGSYLLIGVCYVALRIHALGEFAPQKRHLALNAYQYAINALPLFVQYLEKLLIPLNLNAFYVFHPIISLSELKGVLSLMVTIVFAALLLITLKKNRVAFLGLLFVTVPLLPVLYITALGENTFADRYLYLPSVGYVLLLAIFLSWAKAVKPGFASGLVIISLAVVIVYSVGTVSRNAVWRDNLTLFTDTVRKSPDASIPHNDLGLAYANHNRLDEAMNEFKAALKLKPDDNDLHYNLGTAYLNLNRLNEAANEYITALKLNPDSAKARYNLDICNEKMKTTKR